MSEIGARPASLTPSPGTAGPALVPLGEVGLLKLPDRLAQVARAIVLSGTVIGETADGVTRLRTQAGEVVFRTTMALAADTPMTLQIPAGQPPVKANAFLAMPAAAGGGNALPSPPTGAEPPPVTTTLGAAAKAALAGPDAEATALAPGTIVPGKVLPRLGAPAQGAGDLLAQGAGGLPAPGTTVAVRVLGAAPMMPGEGAEPLARPALVLTGTITGTTAAGQPILTTPQGALALTTRGVVPPGLTLAVEIADPRQMFTHPPTDADAPPRPQPWPTLSETLTTLNHLDGRLAHSLLTDTLPQPNKRLAAALTHFLDSARRGDARGWLGEEAADALDGAGRKDLLKRLEDEFHTTARQAADTPPGEWRPFPVPLFDGNAIQRLEVFIRAVHEKAEDEGEESDHGRRSGERAHRFLVDLNMSQLGPLQLDGLVKARRFDLILRSATPLPESLRADLLGAFTTSLEAVGYIGGLGFQVGARGWIKPAPLARSGHGHGVKV